MCSLFSMFSTGFYYTGRDKKTVEVFDYVFGWPRFSMANDIMEPWGKRLDSEPMGMIVEKFDLLRIEAGSPDL